MRFYSGLLTLLILPLLAFGQTSTKKYEPLLNAAQKTNSSALILLEDGKTALEYYDGEEEKIESMSVTKSVVALAVAQLLTDGKIDSLNTPVATFYPEWRQGKKKDITIRHLMNHTSGLQNVPSTRKEIQPSPDFIQLALCASVVDKPGTKFSYNNKAVNLLSGIIKKAAGKPMDEYLRNGLFKQMGITDFSWRTDDVGNLRAMAGFQVLPSDLAKIGQLVLNKGSWKGVRLIDKKWIEELLEQGQPHTIESGLLWWRIPSSTKLVIDDHQIQKLQNAGLSKEFLSGLNQIKGTYDRQGAAVQALMSQYSRREVGKFRRLRQKKGINPWRGSVSGPIIGYKAEGDLGQFLVIYPEENIVAVRMVQYSDEYDRKTDGFGNFSEMVYKLAN